MDAPARKQRVITSAIIDQSKPASIVIDQRFKGLYSFCRLTGYPLRTVNDWRYRGLIPAHRQAEILAVAAEHGIEIDPADFVEKPTNDGQ